MKITRSMNIDVEVTPEELGRLFIEMDSDAQTRFFVAAAAHAKTAWRRSIDLEAQAIEIGHHLATCSCSTDDARELVESIAYGLAHEA